MRSRITNTIIGLVVAPMISYYTSYWGRVQSEPKKVSIDVTQSLIHWKGTKMLGLGKHEGIVKLQSGFILVDQDMLCGGEFVINMQSIEVTDIPKSDPIPRRNLTNHLRDEDFFAVSRFPTAKLTMVKAYRESPNVYIITANLRIKNITRSIKFKARIASSDKFNAYASITINRQLWNISFKGSAIQNNLVDDEIFLEIHLQV